MVGGDWTIETRQVPIPGPVIAWIYGHSCVVLVDNNGVIIDQIHGTYSEDFLPGDDNYLIVIRFSDGGDSSLFNVKNFLVPDNPVLASGPENIMRVEFQRIFDEAKNAIGQTKLGKKIISNYNYIPAEDLIDRTTIENYDSADKKPRNSNAVFSTILHGLGIQGTQDRAGPKIASGLGVILPHVPPLKIHPSGSFPLPPGDGSHLEGPQFPATSQVQQARLADDFRKSFQVEDALVSPPVEVIANEAKSDEIKAPSDLICGKVDENNKIRSDDGFYLFRAPDDVFLTKIDAGLSNERVKKYRSEEEGGIAARSQSAPIASLKAALVASGLEVEAAEDAIGVLAVYEPESYRAYVQIAQTQPDALTPQVVLPIYTYYSELLNSLSETPGGDKKAPLLPGTRAAHLLRSQQFAKPLPAPPPDLAPDEPAAGDDGVAAGGDPEGDGIEISVTQAKTRSASLASGESETATVDLTVLETRLVRLEALLDEHLAGHDARTLSAVDQARASRRTEMDYSEMRRLLPSGRMRAFYNNLKPHGTF